MSGRAPNRERLAIALFSASALSLQVALGRLLSVVLWYHFAFLIVSTALLGYGLSGAVLALRSGDRARPLSSHLRRAAIGQGLATVLAMVALRLLPFEPLRIAVEPLQLLWAFIIQVGLTAPFFFSGLAVGRILIDRPREAGHLYAIDLLGAGVGAAGALLGIAAFGPLAVVGLGAAAALGAGALFTEEWKCRLPILAGALGIVLLGSLAESTFGLRVASDKRLGSEGVEAVLAEPGRVRESAWDPAARLDLVTSGDHLSVLLDAGAAVVRVPHLLAPLEELPPLRDATSLPFYVQPPRRVLILGSGAGWEVAGALTHGATEVTGVEIAQTLSRWLEGPLKEWTRALITDPRVHWVDGEARSFVHRSSERWDHILSIHTISNAAAVSGALDLAESHTLTVEAVEDYLTHLEADGWLYLTRPEAQLPKLVATAATALRARGDDPADHLVALRLEPSPGTGSSSPEGSFTTGLLISQRPLDPAVGATLTAAAARVGMTILLVPDAIPGPRDPVLLGALSLSVPEGRDPAAFTPATDDRPFFNRRRSWSRLRLSDLGALFGEGDRARLSLEDRPVAELSLFLLLLETLLVAGLVTAFLAWRRRPSEGPPSASPGGAGIQLYFALLGLGFSAVELGLVHRLGLLLGQPGLTFAVSVMGLLLFSGLGSFLQRPLSDRFSPVTLLLGVALGIGATGGLVAVAEHFLLGAGPALRALGALLAIAPAGLALGLPFPLGLGRLAEAAAAERGRAWAINGFASVVGASLSVVLATGAGLTVVFIGGAGAYVLAAFLARQWPNSGRL